MKAHYRNSITARAAIHEAGHAVVAASHGSRVISVQIDRGGGGLCRVISGPSSAINGIIPAIFALGGIAAEGYLLGAGTDPRSFAVHDDLRGATISLGLNWKSGAWDARDQYTVLSAVQDSRMTYAWRRAHTIIEQNEPVLIALADALLQRGRLGAEQIYGIIEAHGGIARLDLAA